MVYAAGGLAMHAGCKVVPTDDGEKTLLIIGLSGTGKTTTTFTRQNGSQPVQDDFIGLFPGGKVVGTENGCFAKTFGLNPDDEPTIHGAVTQPDSYLENVSQQGEDVDFYDTSYTQNGRATFPFRVIEAAAEREIADAHFLLILNRNENVIPAVAKLEGPLAAAFFMLGETQGTSAGGADEAGKFLRVPGTNPFFPLPHDLQGNRFLELLEQHPLEVYLLNTGRVGGPENDERSKKVRIRHSSAIVKGIAEGTISWEDDPDFHYLVATDVPGIDAGDLDVLQPRRLYEATGRAEDYRALAERFKVERAEFLRKYPSLSNEIVAAVR
jgi:phosphoenolpyruvate carboxykinase (ATP)